MRKQTAGKVLSTYSKIIFNLLIAYGWQFANVNIASLFKIK